MKANILDLNGSKKSEHSTDIFDAPIRQDIVQKIVEIEKINEKRAYAPYLWAGMETSASGNVKHNRHVWKTDRGRGFSRFPKKRMSDKGDRFVWIGAVSPETRKGRRAHPPKIARRELKINKKEKILAFKSCLAMAASSELIKKKYSSLSNLNIKLNLPLIVDDKILGLKTKEIFEKLSKILGEAISVAVQDKKVRAGIGKMRNRKYKKNAGMLLVVGNNQDKKIPGIEVMKVKNLRLVDLWDNGARLVMFTESAVKDLESKLNPKIEAKEKQK
jgi:large subunit ribosomal protein L4e